MSEEHSLLSNPMLWYSVSVLIFVYFAFKLGRKPILAVLDAEIAKIRDELEQARQLKAEAESTLADYQDKQKEALAEAARIVSQAKEDAARLHAEAEIDIKKTLERNEQKAVQRIHAAEKDALTEVRAAIISQAVDAAEKALIARLDEAAQLRLADHAIVEAASFAPAVKGNVA